MPVELTLLSEVPSSVEQLASALQQLPAGKATLGSEAPAIMWKATAPSMARHMHEELRKHWCLHSCDLLGDLHRAVLWLMAKPGKAPRDPAALRPISLQHPACKALTGLAIDRAKAERPHLHRQAPCFAYLPQRSAEDCLLRAFGHCKRVRSMMKAPMPHSPARKSTTCGGIQLCIDLSKAFDQIPRRLVEASVRHAKYSHETEVAMLTWLQGGTFEIPHKGLSGNVSCQKGIKQGSRGRPYEWNLVTKYILDSSHSQEARDGSNATSPISLMTITFSGQARRNGRYTRPFLKRPNFSIILRAMSPPELDEIGCFDSSEGPYTASLLQAIRGKARRWSFS